MTDRPSRVGMDYAWLTMFVEESERGPSERNTIEVQWAIVGDVRRALEEITQLRTEVERLERRNEAQRVALDRVSAVMARIVPPRQSRRR